MKRREYRYPLFIMLFKWCAGSTVRFSLALCLDEEIKSMIDKNRYLQKKLINQSMSYIVTQFSSRTQRPKRSKWDWKLMINNQSNEWLIDWLIVKCWSPNGALIIIAPFGRGHFPNNDVTHIYCINTRKQLFCVYISWCKVNSSVSLGEFENAYVNPLLQSRVYTSPTSF